MKQINSKGQKTVDKPHQQTTSQFPQENGNARNQTRGSWWVQRPVYQNLEATYAIHLKEYRTIEQLWQDSKTIALPEANNQTEVFGSLLYV